MARFNALLQSLARPPAFQQGLFDAAKGLGATPAMAVAEKERKARQQGMLSGTLALEDAAMKGIATPEMFREYANTMQGYGVSSEDIINTVSGMRQTNAQAAQQNRTTRFVESLGQEYAALLNAGLNVKQIHDQYLGDKKQESIVSLAQQINPDIDPNLASQLTAKDLMEMSENLKTEEGAAQWAEWQKLNPEINSGNRQSAIEAALAAHGAKAPKIVADLEATQLNNKAKREGKKSLSVIVTMKQDAAMFDLPGMSSASKVQSRNLPVDQNGNLTKEAQDWLEAHATTAMVSDTGEIWNPKPKPEPDEPDPEGLGATLGQVASGLINKLVGNELKE